MKNKIDIIKIDEGRLGVVNLNNMIPVTSDDYELIDLNNYPKTDEERKRQFLLKTQLLWLNKNINNIKSKSFRLYNKYKNNKLPNRIKSRCCNFVLLEEKCLEYHK